jgi:regulator of protease activity HflC (stomatin/prohibitin superfamily)
MNLFYTIPQSHCVIIQRFGKFSRIQTQGLRFRLPLIEKRQGQANCPLIPGAWEDWVS